MIKNMLVLEKNMCTIGQQSNITQSSERQSREQQQSNDGYPF